MNFRPIFVHDKVEGCKCKPFKIMAKLENNVEKLFLKNVYLGHKGKLYHYWWYCYDKDYFQNVVVVT